MRRLTDTSPRLRRCGTVLLLLTLVSSGAHFADNALRLDLYPGPSWLSAEIVLTAWFVVLIAAYLAYRAGTRSALVAYGILGFAGLAHYVMPHRVGLPLRCTVTIGAEATASAVLIVYALIQPRLRRF